MIPGEVRVGAEPLQLNAGRETRTLVVVNGGDRPIQIGSHLHLPDANPELSFDREQAQGFRLDVPAGTSVRFEPGVSRTVGLVAFGGTGTIPGLQITGKGVSAHQREPKRIVPFGTPGTTVDEPARASASGTRVSGVSEKAESEKAESEKGVPGKGVSGKDRDAETDSEGSS